MLKNQITGAQPNGNLIARSKKQAQLLPLYAPTRGSKSWPRLARQRRLATRESPWRLSTRLVSISVSFATQNAERISSWRLRAAFGKLLLLCTMQGTAKQSYALQCTAALSAERQGSQNGFGGVPEGGGVKEGIGKRIPTVPCIAQRTCIRTPQRRKTFGAFLVFAICSPKPYRKRLLQIAAAICGPLFALAPRPFSTLRLSLPSPPPSLPLPATQKWTCMRMRMSARRSRPSRCTR